MGLMPEPGGIVVAWLSRGYTAGGIALYG
jgi:hypothetical protein